MWSTLVTLTSKDSLFHHSKYLQYFSEKKSEISLRKLMSVPQIRKINKWLSLIRNKWHKSSLHTFFISLSESLSSMSGTWQGYERSIINPLVIKQLRNLVRVLCTKQSGFDISSGFTIPVTIFVLSWVSYIKETNRVPLRLHIYWYMHAMAKFDKRS